MYKSSHAIYTVMLIGLAIVVVLISIWYWYRSGNTQVVTQPNQPVASQPVASQPTQTTTQPTQTTTQPTVNQLVPVATPVDQVQPSQPTGSFLDAILAPIISAVTPTPTVDTSTPTSTQSDTSTPTQTTQPNTSTPSVSDPTAVPTPAEIVAINSGTQTTVTPTQTTPSPTPTQSAPLPTQTTTTPTQTTPTQTTPAPVAPWCRNGVYCDNTPIPQAYSTVGTYSCGPWNIRQQCVAGVNGADPTWVNNGIPCDTSTIHACKNVRTQIATGNDGSVSAQRYCAGVNGGAWNGSLPADFNGAKCISAGFNATGIPTGVDCNTAPGIKTGFRQLCQAIGTGWYGAPQVVVRNDGTVSGQRYCAGVNKAPWWNELPTSWGGAKCTSAGFNATGTPTGVDCATVPGKKTGFRVLCSPSPSTPWAL